MALGLRAVDAPDNNGDDGEAEDEDADDEQALDDVPVVVVALSV